MFAATVKIVASAGKAAFTALANLLRRLGRFNRIPIGRCYTDGDAGRY